MTDDAELLPSAYLDDELTAEERARVEADPELLAEAERLSEIRDRVADVEPPSTARREAHLAAALAARGAVEPSGKLPPPTGPRHDLGAPVTSITRSRWRSSTGLVVATAAAVALIIGAGVVLNTAGEGGNDDIASDARSASGTIEPAETEPLDEAEASADGSLDAAPEIAEGDAGAAAPLEEEGEDSDAMTEEAPAESEATADSGTDEATDEEAGDAGAAAEATEEAAEDADAQPDAAEETADGAEAEPLPAIVGVAAFDPDGNGTENNAAAAGLVNVEPAAPWSTVCYADRFMGAKQGVGLVVSFDQPSDRSLVFDVQSAPFQIRFYSTSSPEPPTTFEGWGEAVGEVSGVEPVPVESPVSEEPVNHVLIVFQELGRDPGCSAANPYRGTIGSVRVAG